VVDHVAGDLVQQGPMSKLDRASSFPQRMMLACGSKKRRCEGWSGRWPAPGTLRGGMLTNRRGDVIVAPA
jgi:hypothetical protein